MSSIRGNSNETSKHRLDRYSMRELPKSLNVSAIQNKSECNMSRESYSRIQPIYQQFNTQMSCYDENSLNQPNQSFYQDTSLKKQVNRCSRQPDLTADRAQRTFFNTDMNHNAVSRSLNMN